MRAGMDSAGACRSGGRAWPGEAGLLALLPGRAVFQQGGRISEAAHPGAQFRLAAGGQGQDEAAIIAVFDALVGGPDAFPHIVGGAGGHMDAEGARFVPGQAEAAVPVVFQLILMRRVKTPLGSAL